MKRSELKRQLVGQAQEYERRFSTALYHDVRVEPRKAGLLRVSLDLTLTEAELVLGRLGAPVADGDALDGVVAIDTDEDDRLRFT